MSDEPHPIINCHVHLFTMDHVPRDFLPFRLTQWLRRAPFKRAVTWALRRLGAWFGFDRLGRFADFLKISGMETQDEVFQRVRGYYPSRGEHPTQFVALPMDMTHMGAGAPQEDIETQHQKLAALANGYSDTLLPFIAVDPRRVTSQDPHPGAMIERLLDQHPGVFRGVKLYPPLGYWPEDPVLMSHVFPLCQERGLPVMSHCSRGGVRSRAHIPETAARFADPDAFLPVLDRFPELRVCLAHFGGPDDWKLYFSDPDSREPRSVGHPDRVRMNWLSKLLGLIKSGDYPNLYTDISYTIFMFEQYMRPLKVILNNDAVRKRVLFGSDYYMSEQEEFDERFLSMSLRAELPADVYRDIAYGNPVRWLTGADPA